MSIPPKITTLSDAAKYAVKVRTLLEIDASFDITVDDETWHCYTVAISHRDILCYCDKGCATYLVDSYGERLTHELINWEGDAHV